MTKASSSKRQAERILLWATMARFHELRLVVGGVNKMRANAKANFGPESPEKALALINACAALARMK